MAESKYPEEVKLVLPNGDNIVVELTEPQPAEKSHLVEYLYDATVPSPHVNNKSSGHDAFPNGKAFSNYIMSLPKGHERDALSSIISSKGTLTLFMPFASLGAGVTPANLPNRLHVTYEQVVALIIQAKGGGRFHARHACSFKDICSHCVDCIRRHGSPQPFPEYCAFNPLWADRRCANRIWAEALESHPQDPQ